MPESLSPRASRPLFQGLDVRRFEWPTLALAIGLHCVFVALVFAAPHAGLLAYLALVPVLTLHSSLQHEVLHGHPFRAARANWMLVALPLGVFVPYWRFRALHIAHHHDPALTDPYDDPESWYRDPRDWAALSPASRLFLTAMNTLVGRMLLGPLAGMAGLVVGDARAILHGRHDILAAWAEHLVALALLLWLLVQVPGFSLPAYLAACYGAYALLCLRTFLEHRAEDAVGHRSVVIEDNGPLAVLFLFNSLHAVHHLDPGLPWYRLREAYARDRASVLAGNGGYCYRSYAQIIRRYAFRAKEPVAHPLIGEAWAPCPPGPSGGVSATEPAKRVSAGA
ncbi:fatty acid desaturase [Stappia sp. ES.058]|uniref:fatty acid desaturase n=1 Tax=Stappia sp. ES.058 TaxID=1881061 RepID=UPI0008798657|nr:fatty acid desaturase [Stappia sp. ES.058]SDU21512.1 Fatty acid desaturase [Stappia sp. ES.058]